MSRVELASIRALTFYKDDLTTAKRSRAIPQLSCTGKPCRFFTPEAVRCTNIGGSGTDIDWKCTADLPESLRFGRVSVSCEGWSGPGDPYVLKGSCGLEYKLVEVHKSLLNSQDAAEFDWARVLFFILFFSVFVWILFRLLQSWWEANENHGPNSHRPIQPPRPFPPRDNPGSGWFPGGHDEDPTGPPPPYSKTAGNEGWRPGFWSGAAAATLGNYAWNNWGNNNNIPRQPTPPIPTRRTFWDWERSPAAPVQSPSANSPRSTWGGRSRQLPSWDNHGEGSSSGVMRSSAGYGGSSVR